MEDFLIGDMVRCINPAGKLIFNKIYTVLGVGNSVLKIDANGNVGPYMKFRFTKQLEFDTPVPPAPKKGLDEMIAKAREALADHCNSGDVCQMASFVKVIGESIGLQENAPCHYNIQNNKPVDALIYGLKADLKNTIKEHRPLHKQYCEYIINRSPWADCFLDKDYDKGLEEGLLMDCNKDISMIAGACIALRMGMEYPVLPPFDYLVKNKVGEHAACLIAMNVVLNKDNSIIWTGSSSSHKVFEDNMHIDEVLNFFIKGYAESPEKPYNQNSTGYSVFKRISKPSHAYKDKGLSTFLRSGIKFTKIGSGWDAKESAKAEDLLALAKTIETKFKEIK